MPDGKSSNRVAKFLAHYGMILVLLCLCVFFSIVTVSQQHPAGAAGGQQVARMITQRADAPSVLIVTRATAEDAAFSSSASECLADGGASVIGVVRGAPKDVKTKIQEILNSGDKIDFVAVNSVTAKWTVYDQFPEVGSDKCVKPLPYSWPNFLKLTNLLGVANQTAIYAIIAIGMTMVIITAGIDLSVGSLVALASVCSALCMTRIDPAQLGSDGALTAIGVAVGMIVCACAGAFCGTMVTLFKIPPFIVSLAVMMMASGTAFRLSEGRSISNLPESFLTIGQGSLLGVPNPVIMMIVLYLIAHVVMSRTVFGRYVYAIGGNEEAARLSGVPVRRVLLCVYTICGALAGLGGIVLTSRLAAGDPKFGLMYELDVIAAVVVGGTSLMGGKGRIFGTLIGAFIIAVIKNGMNLTGVDSFNQKIVLGAVLLLAVLLDTPSGRAAIRFFTNRFRRRASQN